MFFTCSYYWFSYEGKACMDKFLPFPCHPVELGFHRLKPLSHDPWFQQTKKDGDI
jgi:hypothetical protein